MHDPGQRATEPSTGNCSQSIAPMS